jgi:hypothetical protein
LLIWNPETMIWGSTSSHTPASFLQRRKLLLVSGVNDKINTAHISGSSSVSYLNRAIFMVHNTTHDCGACWMTRLPGEQIRLCPCTQCSCGTVFRNSWEKVTTRSAGGWSPGGARRCPQILPPVNSTCFSQKVTGLSVQGLYRD